MSFLQELLIIERSPRIRRSAFSVSPFRATGIDRGLLHDISASARRIANVVVHTAITARLWEQVAPGTPFDPSHPAVSQLCYALLLAHASLAPSQRLYLNGARALIFECQHEGRRVLVHCVAHPDEQGQVVATMMLEDENWEIAGHFQNASKEKAAVVNLGIPNPTKAPGES